MVVTWALRYVHIALDTLVLYGVLGARNMDERTGSTTSAAVVVARVDNGGHDAPHNPCLYRSNKPRLIARIRPAAGVSSSTTAERYHSEDESMTDCPGVSAPDPC